MVPMSSLKGDFPTSHQREDVEKLPGVEGEQCPQVRIVQVRLWHLLPTTACQAFEHLGQMNRCFNYI